MADSKRVAAGKRARGKGKVFERQVAKTFRVHGWGMRRAQQYRGTETSADLAHDGSENPPFPLPVECKNHKAIPSYERVAGWLARAERDAGWSPAVVVFKYGRGKVMAAIRAEGPRPLPMPNGGPLQFTVVYVRFGDGTAGFVMRPLDEFLKDW